MAAAQRLTSLIIDEVVALDAGSLALSGERCQHIRNIIITHPHLDHVASLPIFIDDLFGVLERPVRVHTTPDIIATLEKNLFNWMVYPRFSELSNQHGPVLEYVPLQIGETFEIEHLRITTAPVNHGVPTFGLVVDNGSSVVAFSSDTSATEQLWHLVNQERRLDAVILECSFPNELQHLAARAGHLTPNTLVTELAKVRHTGFQVFAMHIKANYYSEVVRQLEELSGIAVRVLEPNRDYSC